MSRFNDLRYADPDSVRFILEDAELTPSENRAVLLNLLGLVSSLHTQVARLKDRLAKVGE